MLVYICVDIIIIALSWLLIGRKLKIKNHSIDGSYLFFLLCGVILFFISAFRGNFTTDYNGYVDNFYSFKSKSLEIILKRSLYSNPENGFALFLYFIGQMWEQPIFVFIISSVIIVFINLKEIKKEKSISPLLAIFLFTEAGLYYISFNFMRQALACSITLLASKYLYNRKFIPYLIIVLFASSFHASVLVLIPFYFLSEIKINRNNIIVVFFTGVIFLIFQNEIMMILHRYFWTWYDLSNYKGYSWKNIVLPLFISITGIALFIIEDIKRDNKEKNDKYENKNNIFAMATLLYILFQLSGLIYNYGQRFSLPFVSYTTFLFGNELVNLKNKKFFEIGIIVVLLLYEIVTRLDNPYYFIWD